ncbi:hypothetical protein NQ318_022767 [Aromia moschata]|uniref:C2H2-type domain-containing protein n=1 Tax=Aromia moschata TaxID=1265417 RepID=A0AAV8YCD5_9CUCU|nr:hypothetical protein NQ318_022767 [Aromia moschata]
MQGAVFMPYTPQQGFPPPSGPIAATGENRYLARYEDLSSPLNGIVQEFCASFSESRIYPDRNRLDSQMGFLVITRYLLLVRATAGFHTYPHNQRGLGQPKRLRNLLHHHKHDNRQQRLDEELRERRHGQPERLLLPRKEVRVPICDKMLTSQHEFTLHIRSHNNENEVQDTEKGYTCRICLKVLSSSSSLDRHVLVHSGERPFHCKYCGDTFTTNGNMHRHMRTHSHKAENSYESDGSTDSGSSKSTEFNNNKVERSNNKRKNDSPDVANKKPRENCASTESNQSFQCPVCERTDFNSLSNLEAHLEDNHPDYPAKCNQCKQVFLNNKQLTAHKAAFHENAPSKHPVVGFKDLTFVDFSSEKFPHIARRECEMNLHKVSGGLKFQCRKCNRAFPCTNSLEIHEKNCVPVETVNGLDLTTISQPEIRRMEFFSRLNLVDNSPEKQPPPIVAALERTPYKLKEHLVKAMDSTKDLADIQSILSNINLQQLQTRHGDLRLSTHKPLVEPPLDYQKQEQEEESQDQFAVEFRKMKLRGEFPCRLCTAVFPNLRSLKRAQPCPPQWEHQRYLPLQHVSAFLY